LTHLLSCNDTFKKSLLLSFYCVHTSDDDDALDDSALSIATSQSRCCYTEHEPINRDRRYDCWNVRV